MSLDIHSTMSQLYRIASNLQQERNQSILNLEKAFELLQSASLSSLQFAIPDIKSMFYFPWCEPYEEPQIAYPAPNLPLSDFCIHSVDGSHIDTDRNLPLTCSLINIGESTLIYGTQPDAYLSSHSYIYAGDDELYITDSDSQFHSQRLEGNLLGLKRAVEEMETLADLIEHSDETLATLGLVDGSLILWQLGGEGPPPGRFPPYVRKKLLEETFLPSLERVERIARKHLVSIAGYISMPGSSEVVNLLRLILCDYQPHADCPSHCANIPRGQRHCDGVHSILDRDLFSRFLNNGERSSVFKSRSPVVNDYYGSQAIYFFYLHNGKEIARVEIPEWIAQTPTLLNMTHFLLLDQCSRGNGYPAALQEAHEQAVINTGDREEFRAMVELALESSQIPMYTSEKQTSKRRRWV